MYLIRVEPVLQSCFAFFVFLQLMQTPIVAYVDTSGSLCRHQCQLMLAPVVAYVDTSASLC